jgi:hypothetical protein
MPQQGGGDQPDAILYPRRPHQAVGGVIGAGGAALAVYVALSSQRQEETAKVSAAVVTEVASLTTYVIGAVSICQEIASNVRRVPRQDAGYIMRKPTGCV